MDYITDIESRHKCAYEQCQCQIPSAQEYCCEYCSEADDVNEVELQCDCKTHSMCSGLSACFFCGTSGPMLLGGDRQ
jgi:hypothetical protein